MITAIFKPVVPAGFEWILPDVETDFDRLRNLTAPYSDRPQQPIPMHLLREDSDGVPRRPANMPWLGEHAFVLSEGLLIRLGHQAADWGEFLQLASPEGRYFLFRATSVADVLDWDESDVVRFGSNRVMRVTRPVFRAEGLPDRPFKVPGFERGTLFLPGGVVAAIQSSGSTGTEFEQVWPKDVGEGRAPT